VIELGGDGGATAVVDARDGGRVARWTVGGHDLLVASGPAPEAWGCYPMVPWAGRTRTTAMRLLGRKVRLLPQSADPHPLHGVGVWLPWRVGEVTATSAVLHLDMGAPAARAMGWPFGGEAVHEVAVEGDALHLRLAVTADDEPLPLTMGWHPWFPRHLAGVAGEVEGAIDPDVVAGAAGMYQRGPDGLPTGAVVPPTPGPWDDCLVGLAADPSVRWPGVGAVVVSSAVDHWVVFDGHPRGLCVEPQSGPPDAFTVGGYAAVAPGTTATASATLRWLPDGADGRDVGADVGADVRAG
jgi:aldose 1-epimerase